MTDLHTHSILSDGELIPSELVRRAQVAGLSAIAVTDHADSSNIEEILPCIVKVCRTLNKYWDIFVIPGIELTHIPLETFGEMTELARARGAEIVVAHGESPVEPVIPGTNRAAIEAGVDILAHPGFITAEDAELAALNRVFLEITTRKGHCRGNEHVIRAALSAGAQLVLNTDTHSPKDILTPEERAEFLKALVPSQEIRAVISANSEMIVRKVRDVSQRSF